MNTIIEEIRKRIKAEENNIDTAGDYDEYADGQGVGLEAALNIIDEVEKEQSATAMNQDKIKSCKELYNDIDSCIEALIKARLGHNQEDEGKALFRMEGLMVAALQQLSCFIDKPVPADVEEAAEMAARRAYPYEGGTKGEICEASIHIFCNGFKAGIAYERERLMKEAPVADVIEMRGSTGPFADYPFMLSLGFLKIPNIEYHGGKVRVIIEEIKE